MKIGIVGAGEITRQMHLPVLLNVPEVEVAWLYDRSERQAASLAAAFGLQAVAAASAEALPFCDVALLAVPVNARQDYLRVFADRHTAVFCEKPFAISGREHLGALGAFPAHQLGVGYMRRFYSSTTLMRSIVAEGWLGPLRGVRIEEGDRSKGSGVDQSFLNNQHLGAARGVLMDLGSHTIDLALQICTAEAYTIQSCDIVFDGAVDRKLSARIELQNSRGEVTIFDYCVSWLDRQRNLLQLNFDHATVWSGLSPSATVFLGDPAHPERCISLSTAGGASTFNQAFYLEWRSFLDGVLQGKESQVSARSATLTTTLVEELLMHGRAGRV
ncbi:MAG TPA: Gfo/Idh/MocA family oxidoreductase [Steroidobacteraceae bacterium]|nr:Gfo/Idh/MocA family oxidoreductase [Steroidobacteraceae bacterium]